MVRGLVLLLVGALFGIGGALAYYTSIGRGSIAGMTVAQTAGAENAGGSAGTPISRRSIMALGTIEPTAGTVHLSSPLIGYRIQQVHVEEGQPVKSGDLLIELDPATAEAELQLAKTQRDEAIERQNGEIALANERVAAAEIALQHAVEGAQLEVDAQQSQIDVAALKVRQAEQDLNHLEELRGLAEPLASEQQVEHQRIMLDGAQAEHEAARVALKRLEQSLRFRERTAAAELRAAKQALALAEKGIGIESLEQTIAMAELKLAQTKISAPNDGVVLNVMAHPGEIVAQQPLLQMADLDSLVCIAEVDAADVSQLKPNHPARITSRAFPDTVLEGTVQRVGSLVSQASLRPLDPRQPVDRNVAKAVILIDAQQAAQSLRGESDQDRRPALVGLQVEVEFPLTE